MARIMPLGQLVSRRRTGCPDSGGPAARWRRSGRAPTTTSGSTWSEEATNFAVWAPEATAAYVCLVDDDGTETRHRLTERSLGIWHGAVPGIEPGQRYGYRVAGPVGARAGAAVQPAEAAARPVRAGRQRRARAGPGDLRLHAWAPPETARPPRLRRQGAAQRGRRRPVRLGRRPPRAAPLARHRHLRAARQGHDPAARPGARGAPRHVRRPRDTRRSSTTCRDLGVTAVELLPVHQFATEPAVAARGLTNYWGYNSIGFFAPHAAYSSSGDRGEQVTEFKAMVKAFHDAGPRGDPRRRLQPHRRGRGRRADAVASAGWTTRSTTGCRRGRPVDGASTTPTGT